MKKAKSHSTLTLTLMMRTMWKLMTKMKMKMRRMMMQWVREKVIAAFFPWVADVVVDE